MTVMPFGIIEGPAHVSQPSTNPYREGGQDGLDTGCFAMPYRGLSRVR